MRKIAPLLLAWAFANPVIATASETSRPIPFQPTEFALAGGESHRWHVALSAGDYFRVVIEQRGIDVVVEGLGTDGKVLVEVDNPNGRQGPEPLTLIASIPGQYQVVVHSPSADVPAGNYELRATTPRPASAADRRHHQAERSQLAAHRAGTGANRNAEGFGESVRLYREVLQEWRALGERAREAEVLLRLGTRLRVLQKSRESQDALQRALRIYTELGHRQGEASTWTQLGLVAWAADDVDGALHACREALKIWEALGDSKRAAATLNTLGLVNYRTGRLDEALTAYERALKIFHSAADRRAEAFVLHNLGGILNLQGDPVGALDHYQEALEVARARGNKSFEAEILHNQGNLFFRLGEAQESLQHYNAALPIFRELGDQRRQAAVLGSLGILYLSLRDFDRALRELGAAIEIEKAIGDQRGQAWSLHSLGAVYRDLGKTARALPTYRKSLELFRAVEDRRGQAAALVQLGATLAKSGQLPEALTTLEEAYEIHTSLGTTLGQTQALLERGRVQATLRAPKNAEDDFQRALSVSRSAGLRTRETEALYALANLESERGNLTQAWRFAEQALDLAESHRVRIAGNDLRTSYFTSLREIYEFTVGLLVRRARREGNRSLIAQAFEIAERARARGLLDQLRETRHKLQEGVDPRLLAQERRLRLEVNDKAERQRRQRESPDTAPQARALVSEIESQLEELEDVQAKIRAVSPGYALLTHVPDWQLADFQTNNLDDETLLLEYFLGAEQSFLWAVTRERVEVYNLPPRAELEALVREVFEMLKGADPRHAAQQRLTLAELSQILLGPIQERLEDVEDSAEKRLVIIADGALQYVPFSILPNAGKPLIVAREIVNLPSAMVLRELRQPRAVPQGTSALALFADPVFSTADPRAAALKLQVAAPSDGPSNSGPTDSPTATRGEDESAAPFVRLPWTRREADAILETVRAQVPAEQVFFATGFESTVETVSSADLGDYRILHFATHGELDSVRPQLSALVLSRVDESGQPRDGFLRLHDIYNLDLGAELVVLSGCRTALGREILGEGLESLTRGFFHAGARRVLASLWSVQDEATAELMSRFYRGLFEQRLSPAAALRAAQISMWQERRFRDPFYWGAFVLQGD